ncbi:MAG: CDP-alcohol phosphatidyltransferase family protein [Deltaproteobacteria bacterium]|nr:CDP-alcohol phosphatidyltransferase family protein [Deltaproteobacteria bacterium]
MNFNSIWISLGPLIGFNVLLLSTVLVFRPVYRKRDRLKEVEERPASRLLNRWMREYWLWLTDPFVRLFVRLGISPNTLTTIGVVIGFISGYFFWKGHFGLGGWLMIFGATFDTFDGRVARATNRESKSGAYYDSVMDRISEGTVFIGLALYYHNHWALWIVLAGLLGAFMVSYTRAKGDSNGISYEGGSMQRPERIVYLGVGAIFAPVFGHFLKFLSPNINDYLYLLPLGFVTLMCWSTSFNRIHTVMKRLDEKSGG